MTDLAEVLVSEQEGLRLTAYRDTRGLWTVGYGHLLGEGRDWTGYTISQGQADNWLEEDMASARIIAKGFPHFMELSDVRQAVLISVSYQLGSKPLHWPVFMQALRDMDYAAASEAGLDSLWYQQTPSRARLEMDMLRLDQWLRA